jgi:hypothetical protein
VRGDLCLVNGQPGALVRDAQGRLISVLTIDVYDDGTIHGVRNILNPDKLNHLGPLSDYARFGSAAATPNLSLSRVWIVGHDCPAIGSADQSNRSRRADRSRSRDRCKTRFWSSRT